LHVATGGGEQFNWLALERSHLRNSKLEASSHTQRCHYAAYFRTYPNNALPCILNGVKTGWALKGKDGTSLL